MKTKNSFLLAIGFLSLSVTVVNAQVGINNTAANPDPSAILDLKSGNSGVNKGFLPQSVQLTSVSVAAPVTSPATGLIVYSSSAPSGGNGIGYYYWTGSAWASMSSSASSLIGSGTTNYVARWTGASSLGTGLIQDNGTDVGVNTAPSAGFMLFVSNSTGNAIYGENNNNSYGAVDGYNGTGIGVYGDGGTYGVYGTGTDDGAYFEDGTGKNYAYLGDVGSGYGVYAKGASSGGYFTDADGDYADAGYSGYGIVAYGSSTSNVGGRFESYGGAECWIGDGVINAGGNFYDNAGTEEGIVADGQDGAGVFGYSSASGGFGGYFKDNNGDYSYGADNADGYGSYSYGINEGAYFLDAAGNEAWIADGGWPGGANIRSAGGNSAQIADDYVGSGVTAYGSNYGGYFTDLAGDKFYAGDNGSGYGSFSVGVTDGAAFEDNNGDYGYLAYSPQSTGGYFQDAGGDYAYIAYSGYGILSNGTKSTMVKDENNKERVLFCDESPEVVFHDYGTAQLSGGKAHINLDPLYARTVAINDKHPLRVLVTLNDECNGVFVKNRTTTGFDVVELNHGASNASFTYEVIANRADTKNAKGETYNYSDWRYPVGPDAQAKPNLHVVKAAKVQPRPAHVNQASQTAHIKQVAPAKPVVPFHTVSMPGEPNAQSK